MVRSQHRHALGVASMAIPVLWELACGMRVRGTW